MAAWVVKILRIPFMSKVPGTTDCTQAPPKHFRCPRFLVASSSQGLAHAAPTGILHQGSRFRPSRARHHHQRPASSASHFALQARLLMLAAQAGAKYVLYALHVASARQGPGRHVPVPLAWPAPASGCRASNPLAQFLPSHRSMQSTGTRRRLRLYSDGKPPCLASPSATPPLLRVSPIQGLRLLTGLCPPPEVDAQGGPRAWADEPPK